VEEQLATGEQALVRGAWEAARSAFEAALGTEESADAFDGLARALWWLDRPAEAIEARISAYALLRRHGELARAVRVALWLVHEYSTVHGNEPAADGWLARAEHLLAEREETPEHGFVELARAERCLDPAVAADHAQVALELARRLDDADLELAALSQVGLAEIALGRVEEGLHRFDEAMAAATGEEAASMEAVAQTCCSLVLACDLAGDADRVRYWGEVVGGYVRRRDQLPLLSFCPTCETDLLAPTERPGETERELTVALAELTGAGRRSRCIEPAVRLAQLRLAQGRVEEAEEVLVGYAGSPAAVRAEAAIRLARGEAAAAVALLERRLGAVGRSGLLAAPLLAQLVDARIANEDGAGAGEAAEQLDALAAQAGNARIAAIAAAAAGRVARASASPEAVTLLEQALELLTRLRMPHEEARTRLELAGALRDTQGMLAVIEARAALAAFERLGARVDADRAAALLREWGVRGRTGLKDVGILTEREQEVLRLLGPGLTNREIASRLYLSPKTVEHHVSAVLSKLGLKTRSQAAALATRVPGPE
jgi:DNA-binding NarL/FixJ family response regulator